MRKTTIYCLAGCCVTLVAIGLVNTSSEKTARASRDSEVESVRRRDSVRSTPLSSDSKGESAYSRKSISSRLEQTTTQIADVPRSLEAKAPVANALEEDVTRLAQLGVEGAEVLPDLLERALATPENNSDDLEFMTAYHKVRTAAPATIQEN